MISDDLAWTTSPVKILHTPPEDRYLCDFRGHEEGATEEGGVAAAGPRRVEEKEFFNVTKNSERVVVHFYKQDSFRLARRYRRIDQALRYFNVEAT